MPDQRTRTIEVSVVLPKTFETQDALARVVLFDMSADAQPFTKLDTYDIFAGKCTGRILATFDNIPPVAAYGVMTHVQINRETYSAADAFQDMRPGDCVTPLMVPINLDEVADCTSVEVVPVQLIEQPPLLGEAY